MYDFRHQLLRDALYATIPASDRRRFHARAGEFGARLEGASEIHASVHYERAGLRREAFEAALAGAKEAARLSARREAFELYRRAVDNMPDDLAPEDRAAIMVAYGDHAGDIEEHDVAIRMAHEAAAIYRAIGMPVQAISALGNEFSVWRREARPLADRVAMAHAMWTELEFDGR